MARKPTSTDLPATKPTTKAAATKSAPNASAAAPTAAAPAKAAPKTRGVRSKAAQKAQSDETNGTRKGRKAAAAIAIAAAADGAALAATKQGMSNKEYLKELARLQIELVKLQEWIRHAGLKIVVIFEGRDAAGKGGAIKRVTESLSPRVARVVALPAPTERERTQWYFQRYVAHLPAAGEMVLFDRSWYNRAGVERVMGFCTEKEYKEFMRSAPEFEQMLVRSGIKLIKYWFSVADEEQERRFRKRIDDPTRRWKLSPMDLHSRSKWVEYSRAKDEMFRYTDIPQAPWYVVNSDDKKRARLNVINHLLSLIPYKDLTPAPIKLPRRQQDRGYVRPPINEQKFVPERY
jgi:polyphosphate kinase